MKKSRPAKVERFAYCLADGVLLFGPRCPKGALTISVCRVGEDVTEWSDTIQGFCRRAYDGETFLIPGIPEASDQFEAVDALSRFTELLRKTFEVTT